MTISENTNNPMICQAAGAILELNADEKLRQRIIDRKNALNDYNSEMSWNRAEGRKEGRAEGRKEGRAETLSEVEQRMRKEGFTEDQIKRILGS